MTTAIVFFAVWLALGFMVTLAYVRRRNRRAYRDTWTTLPPIAFRRKEDK